MSKESVVILKELHGIVGRAHVGPTGITLQIMVPACEDSDAMSVGLYTVGAVKQLRDLCDEALKAYDEYNRP